MDPGGRPARNHWEDKQLPRRSRVAPALGTLFALEQGGFLSDCGETSRRAGCLRTPVASGVIREAGDEGDLMVAVLVVLTILALVALDYFVLRKRSAATVRRVRLPGLAPLSGAVGRVPAGVFLQPSYTWCRIRRDGDLALGVHPLLLGLVGAPYRIELLPDGSVVERGAPLVRVRRGARQLTVRSPVTGRIVAVNRVIGGETEWVGLEDDGGSWFYRIRPERVADEVPQWLIAERAVEWTRRQYDRLRTFLVGPVGTGHVGVTMADGGEIPVGVLTNLSAEGWEAFQAAFLDRDS